MATHLALTLFLLATAQPATNVSANIEPDVATGWNIIVLRHAGRGGDALEARIAPEAGANLFSLRFAGEELLAQPKALADLTRHGAGTPILFPTPNRVRDAAMTFEGRRFTFEPNNGKNFIHGLARARPWNFEPPAAGGKTSTARLFLDWTPEQPDFAKFPVRHRLTVTYTLRADGLRIAFAVENRDQARLPFGFGLHPWFRVPGERKDVFLTVPATHRMEAEEKLPTGELIAVAGTPYDLRRPVSLEGLALDDVYFGLAPAARPGFAWRDRGIAVTLSGSREFTHLVVYTPPGKPFFCLENQTSSTDAHNLHARGAKRQAHLLVAGKGRTVRGFVDWKVRRTKPIAR